MHHGSVWENSEKVKILREMWTAGDSAGVIAKALGCTRNAVIGKADRLNLETRTRSHNHPEKPKGPRVRKRHLLPRIPRPPRLKPEPIVTPILDHAIPLEQRRTLMTLEWSCCHFPVNDPGTPEFFYCGGEVPDDDGRRYCAAHRKRMYKPVPPRRKGSSAGCFTPYRLARG